MKQIDPRSLYRQAVDIQEMAAEGDRFDALPAVPRQTTTLSEQAREVAALFSDRPISRRLLAGSVRAIEFAAILLAGYAALIFTGRPTGVVDPLHLSAVPFGAALTLLFVQAFDGYQIAAFRDYAFQLGRIVASWSMVFAALAALAFFAGLGETDDAQRLVRWYFLGLAFFVLFRFVLTRAVRGWTRDGRLERRAVIVGGGKLAEDLIRSLESQPGNRSEERRVGKECRRLCRSRWSPYH
jgi:hypothetical protein